MKLEATKSVKRGDQVICCSNGAHGDLSVALVSIVYFFVILWFWDQRYWVKSGIWVTMSGSSLWMRRVHSFCLKKLSLHCFDTEQWVCVCLKVTKALQANCFLFLSFDSSLVLRFSFVSVVTFFLYIKLYFPHFIRRLNQIKEYQRMFHMNKKNF